MPPDPAATSPASLFPECTLLWQRDHNLEVSGARYTLFRRADGSHFCYNEVMRDWDYAIDTAIEELSDDAAKALMATPSDR
jgi:hypothetical protein